MRQKRERRTLALLLALCLLLGAAGCGDTGGRAPEDAAEGAPESKQDSAGAAAAPEGESSAAVTVTDMMGREITLDGPARRLVVLTAADCEVLYAIGAGDTLVGRGKYCDYPAEIMDIPAVESGSTTNLEEVIALKPDVLLMGDMDQPEEQVYQLEAAGIPVVVTDVHTLEGVYTSIELIGELVGREDSAAALIREMQETFIRIRESSAGDGSQTIYFEVSPLQYGLWTAGAGTFMDSIAEMLGLTNCFADVEDWGEISEEQVLERNPDFIVTVTMYYGEGPTPEEEILSRPGWENVTAVKNGAVLRVQDDQLTRPGPRLADGAEKLYEFVCGS